MHELPSRRESVRQKLVILHASGRASLYIDTYHDLQGRILSVFIDVEKTGADERGYVGMGARAISKLLCQGVSIEEALGLFDFKSNPVGAVTGYPKLGFCRGYLDAARKYLLAYQEELHAKQTTQD